MEKKLCYIKVIAECREVRTFFTGQKGSKNNMGFIIERLPMNYMEEALILLREVFTNEQNIPVELHNIEEDLKPVWWCAKIDSEIVGIAAGWIEKDGWHWGRFAVNKRLRGLGIGKKLAIFSLNEIFNLGAEKISVEARDITVDLLKKLGGKVAGEPINFYGDFVTPIILKKHDFLNYIRINSNVMMGLDSNIIPKEATQALEIILELFESTVVGVYLYGSAVIGGLRVNSDVDVLVIVNHSITDAARSKLVSGLMNVSGKIGNRNSVRPLEVTIININDVVPWSYPPKKEFIYGEWLRTEFEKGQIQKTTYDPDLAIILTQTRKTSVSLFGPKASDILEAVPMTDILRAIKDSLPGLIEGIKGDERNVILTLARMWLTVATGEISPKDVAAEWAIPRLPKVQANLLDIARKAYRGECIDRWEGLESEVAALVNHMKKAIESYLSISK